MLMCLLLLAAVGAPPDRAAAEKDLPASAIRAFLAGEASAQRFCVDVAGKDPTAGVVERIGSGARRLVAQSVCADDESLAEAIHVSDLVWESPTFVSLLLKRESSRDDGRNESRAYEFAWRKGVWVPVGVYVTLSCT